MDRETYLGKLKKFDRADKDVWRAEYKAWLCRNWRMRANGAIRDGRRTIHFKPAHIRLLMSLTKGIS